jgi:hypothetical protein
MKLPPYTKSQKKIINHLYKFRYLSIRQLQFLFNHKDPKRIKAWASDLKDKKYIDVIKEEHDRTKPYIFCLAQKARHILVHEEDIDHSFLERLYKEKTYSKEFMQRHLFIVDTYLYFLKTKDKKSEMSFFTKQDLKGYDYFPYEMPDAYIDMEEGKTNSRYFLDYFDSKATSKQIRFRIKFYFEYYDEGSWQDNTDHAPFPGILLIIQDKYLKKHAYYYAQALLKKSMTNDIEIFVALQDSIKFPQDEMQVWDNVENTMK